MYIYTIVFSIKRKYRDMQAALKTVLLRASNSNSEEDNQQQQPQLHLLQQDNLV